MNDCIPSWIVLVALIAGIAIGTIIGIVVVIIWPADDDHDCVKEEDGDDDD